MTPQEARNAYRREYRKNMTPDQRKREKEYNREWRRNHPDLVKAAQVKYWTKKAAELNKAAAIPDDVEIRQKLTGILPRNIEIRKENQYHDKQTH